MISYRFLNHGIIKNSLFMTDILLCDQKQYKFKRKIGKKIAQIFT